VGFVGVTVWIENNKLEQLHGEIVDQKAMLKDTQDTQAAQGEKILIGAVSINSLSQDLVDQRELIRQLEQEVNTVKEAVDKKSGSNETLQSKAEEKLKSLTSQLETEGQKLREMELMEGQHTVRINAIQQRIVGIDGQILMMREQFLMRPEQPEEPIQRALPVPPPTPVPVPTSQKNLSSTAG